MNPAFSVVFLTHFERRGAGSADRARRRGMPRVSVCSRRRRSAFYHRRRGVSVVLGGLGLLASFFHLGHPEARMARDRDVADLVVVA